MHERERVASEAQCGLIGKVKMLDIWGFTIGSGVCLEHQDFVHIAELQKQKSLIGQISVMPTNENFLILYAYAGNVTLLLIKD